MHREAAACSGPPRKAATRLRRPRRAGGAPQSQGQLALQGGQGTARCSAATAAGEARTEVTGDGGCDPSARGGAARSGLPGAPAATPARPAAQHRQPRTGCTPRRSGPACRQGTARPSRQHLPAGGRLRAVDDFSLMCCKTLHKPSSSAYPRPTWGSPTPRPWPGRACRGSVRRRPPRPPCARGAVPRQAADALRASPLDAQAQAPAAERPRSRPAQSAGAGRARRARPTARSCSNGCAGPPRKSPGTTPRQGRRQAPARAAGPGEALLQRSAPQPAPGSPHQRGPRAPTARSRSGQAARGAPVASPLPCPDQQQAPPGWGSAPRRFLVLRRSTIFSARVAIAALICGCAGSPLPGCSQARRQL
jgi:hypothetical protein